MLPSDLWDGAEFSVTDPSGRMKEPTPLYSLLTSTGTLRLADKHRHTQTDRYRHTDRHRHTHTLHTMSINHLMETIQEHIFLL